MSLTVLITVVHPHLELPHALPHILGVGAVQQTEGVGPEVAQQD